MACPRSSDSTKLRRRLEVRKGGLPPALSNRIKTEQVRGGEVNIQSSMFPTSILILNERDLNRRGQAALPYLYSSSLLP